MKRKGMRPVWGVLLATFCLLGAARESRASAILSSRADLSPGSQLLEAPDFDAFSGSVDVPYNGGAETATFSTPGGFTRYTQSTDFDGNFAVGDPLFSTSSPVITLDFTSSDITEIGTQFQTNTPGLFEATLTTYDEFFNEIGTYTTNGNSNNNADNSAVFVGLRNAAGEPFIRSATFRVSNTLPPDDPEFVDVTSNGFVINQVSISNASVAAVPEPSTYAMFGLGVLALVALQKRKRRDISNGAVAFSGAAC